jgi:hypothetical protein
MRDSSFVFHLRGAEMCQESLATTSLTWRGEKPLCAAKCQEQSKTAPDVEIYDKVQAYCPRHKSGFVMYMELLI